MKLITRSVLALSLALAIGHVVHSFESQRMQSPSASSFDHQEQEQIRQEESKVRMVKSRAELTSGAQQVAPRPQVVPMSKTSSNQQQQHRSNISGGTKMAPSVSELRQEPATKKVQQVKQETKSMGNKQSVVAASKRQVAIQEDSDYSPDLSVAASKHKGHSYGKYYMYTEVPKKGAYKMGFKRGNKKHTIERKESVHGSHVHSTFKWHDKKGKGSHKFVFKHHDKHKKHH